MKKTITAVLVQVAAIVAVDMVDSRRFIDEDAELTALIGKGKCIELAFINNLLDLDWSFLRPKEENKK